MPPRFTSRTACLLVCLLLLPAAHASDDQPGTVYTGTLGTKEIVLELDPPDAGAVEGRYFYTRHHRDLPLSGKMVSADHLQLSEGHDDDSDRPQMDLLRQPDGGWVGHWQNAQGRMLRLSLQPASISPAADTSSYLKRVAGKNPYEYLRLRGLSLKPGRKQAFMGHQLQWWIEPDSKITLFQILDGYPASQRDRINGILMDRLWDEVHSFHECMASADALGGDFEQTITPWLLSPNLISISVFTSYDCGGAHPDFGDAPINLDARTGSSLSLEDILWIGKGKPFHYAHDSEGSGDDEPDSVDFEAYSHYRLTAFAPWLERQLASVYPSKMTPGENADEDECGYDDPSVWQFPSFHLTPNGVAFSPSFPRVARVCEVNDDWSVLPYARIVKHPGRVSLSFP